MTSPEYQAPTWVNEDDPDFLEGVSPDLGAGYLNQLSGAVEDHGQRLGAITPVVTNLQNTAITQDAGDNRYILQANAAGFAPAEATASALAGKAATSANLSDLASATAARTNLGLAVLAASGKLADATDVTTTGAAIGQLLAVAEVSGGAPSFELVDTTEITPADIGAQPAGSYATLVAGTIPDAQIPAGIARDSEVAAAVAALVASSPAALDTLNELATALGNDPAFATTITNALAGKAPAQTTIYLPAAALGSIGNSPTIASAGAGGFVESWILDQTTNETLGTTLRLPAGWTTYSIKVRGANFAAGTGDVVLRASYGAKTVGDNLTTGFTTGTAITLTAGAIGVMQEVTLATGVAADPTKDTVISVGRRASDAADTLANDYGISAVILTKES